MDEHLPWWLLGMIDWPGYRLFGECWAEECPVPSRRNILHSPAQLRRCEGTPMAIVLNEARYAELTGEPVVPVSSTPSRRDGEGAVTTRGSAGHAGCAPPNQARTDGRSHGMD